MKYFIQRSSNGEYWHSGRRWVVDQTLAHSFPNREAAEAGLATFRATYPRGARAQVVSESSEDLPIVLPEQLRDRPHKGSPKGAHARTIHRPKPKARTPQELEAAAEHRKREQEEKYRAFGRTYATPPPPGSSPQPEATLREIRRAEAAREGRFYNYGANASDHYKNRITPYEAKGCTYQGKNTADGRCPKCGHCAHRQVGQRRRRR